MLNIWKIDYSAVHDGPGIRTSLYLKGCPLRCVWCSNPEGQTPGPDLVFTQSRCMDCGQCIERCPSRAIESRRDPETRKPEVKVNRIRCNLCGECLPACSPKALEIWGREYRIPEILKVIEKNRPLYRKSGGGITLTGGDPLYQSKGAMELIGECRKRGIHTAIETSAYGSEDAFQKILEEVDWVFIDLKHLDPEEHLKLTGKGNDLILKNLRRASSVLWKRDRKLVIRMVVVPGVNDGLNVRRTADFLASLPHIDGIEFLPYHRYAVAKYELLSRPYRLSDLPSPSEASMEYCSKVMKSYGPVIKDMKRTPGNPTASGRTVIE